MDELAGSAARLLPAGLSGRIRSWEAARAKEDFVTGASGVPRAGGGEFLLSPETGRGGRCGSNAKQDARVLRVHAAGALTIMIAMAMLALSAGVGASTMGQEGIAMSLAITSTAFAANAAIPALYTCEGRDISPPLAFGGVPAGTKSLALIVDDPDAPDPAAPKMTWVHWVLYDIPPTATGLGEGIKPAALPTGTREGRNDFGRTTYRGPCPPIGRHRYFFKLYALDAVLPALSPATKATVEQAMQGHVLAQATLMGTYQKQK